MRKTIPVMFALLFLTGCELMEDMAYSESKSWVGTKSFGDGFVVKSYEIDIYNNFDGTNVGVGYEFVGENEGYRDICARIDFSTINGATAYHYNYVQRIPPGGSVVLATASRYQPGRINVKPAPAWAVIESWERCDNVRW